ncbi:MAG: DivIVA domain-containing protein [Candidatus Limnocylindrales bacterium]
MSEDPQVVSISSSTPLSPDEIARKSFPSARRGVDGEAVRTFLGKVAAELRGAFEREAILRERVAEAERRAEEPVLDEATLTRAIGIETAKILWTAHDAAGNVVAKAEERAAELIAEAERVLAEQIAASKAEALEIRAAAEQEAADYMSKAHVEADSMTDVAHADAVELLDATKEECRRMVAEARELRNRALADLMGRRRALRVQLEELRTGKDSLLQVVDTVAASVDELRERLASAEDEARIAAEHAGQRVAQELGHGGLVELEEELAAGHLAGGDDFAGDEGASSGAVSVLERQAEGDAGTGAAPAGESGLEDERDQNGSNASRRSVEELFARIRASRAAEEAAELAPPDVPVGAGPEQTAEPVGAASAVPEAGEEPTGQSAPEVTEPTESGEAVTAVQEENAEATDVAVAAETTEALGKTPEADAITEPDVESLARRDHLLGPVTAKLGRALKRALQDDQNDLLNALRQASGKPVLDELVPPNTQR